MFKLEKQELPEAAKDPEANFSVKRAVPQGMELIRNYFLGAEGADRVGDI